MSLQLILRTPASVVVLGDVAKSCDVFAIPDGTLGVAIPAKVIEVVGEDVLLAALARTEYFDLWSGEWRRPADCITEQKR